MSWQCIIKNTTAAELPINDLGLSIPASTDYNAHIDPDPEYKHVELASSEDLKAAVTSGDAVINDGTSDLSSAQGLRHLELNQDLDADTIDALLNANGPSSSNPVVVQSDLSSLGQDSLDSAYDNGGSGAGRTITADAGAIRVEGMAVGNAGFSLAPRTAKATSLTEGDTEYMKDANGNITDAVYDGTRAKLLSKDKETHYFFDGANTANRYIQFQGVRSNELGAIVDKDATIVRAIVKADTPVTADIKIEKRSALGTAIATISLAAEDTKIVGNLDIDLAAGDELAVYWDQTTDKADNPRVKLYTRERY